MLPTTPLRASLPDPARRARPDPERQLRIVGARGNNLKSVTVALPVGLFNDYQNNQSAMIGALPGLRPGASINQGERITQVTLTGNQMAIRWKTQSAAV